MQSWHRRPTQCVLCAFRQSKTAARSARGRREFSNVAPSQREQHQQPRRPSSRAGEAAQKLVDRLLTKSDAPGYPGRPRIRAHSGHYRLWGNDEHDKEQLAAAVEKAMKMVKKRLETKRVDHEDPNIAYEIQALDPKGTLWPAYAEHVSKLHTKAGHPSSNASSFWSRLHRTYFRGRPDDRKQDLVTELYLGFLDYAIKPLSSTDLGNSASLVDIRYPTEWYLGARQAQRTIHLHVGPTNSGKTYNALKRLQESKNGFYAGPLRLLAHEVYSRFRAKGISCDLITGDDIRLDPDENTKVYASTVEMVKTNKEVEVAVIDEIQMMASPDRGWAWTRAFLGADAKEVHLCGEARVVPLIRELAASMGDALKIHHYERLNPLRCMSRSLKGNLKLLQKGDCVVAFSVMQIHAMKRQIELATGKRCAIVYGSLPPETRAAQADLFNDPDNEYDYLVASDAIGMGLNLSVKRIIFSTTQKYDGGKMQTLTIPQIKQIAGRAGRFRSAHQDKTKSIVDPGAGAGDNVGLVTCLEEADMPIIKAALATEAPPLRKAGIIPPAEYLEEYAARLPIDVPFEFLMRKVCSEATIHPRFFLCDVRDKLELARVIDDVKGLTIEQRVNITAAPAQGRHPGISKCLRALARIIAKNEVVSVADVKEIPLEVLAEEPRPDRDYLESLENLHKCLILYLWLSYRFVMQLRDQPMAIHAKELTEQKINWTLRAFSANPKLRDELKKLRKEQKMNEKLGAQLFDAGAPAEENERAIDPDASMPVEAFEDMEGHSADGRSSDAPVAMGEGEENLLEHFAPPTEIAKRNTEAQVEGTTGVDGLRWQEPRTQEEPVSDEIVTTPDEERVVDQQFESARELKPDPADKDVGRREERGTLTAKDEDAEIVDVSPTQSGEEAAQPRSASGSG